MGSAVPSPSLLRALQAWRRRCRRTVAPGHHTTRPSPTEGGKVNRKGRGDFCFFLGGGEVIVSFFYFFFGGGGGDFNRGVMLESDFAIWLGRMGIK